MANVEVSTDRVKNLINAISHLHPIQFLLAGNDHTDDYPSWTVEMTDQAGNRVQLSSSSTANPGQAPWNIIYNGRLYAQYDGSLSDPLLSLFPGPSGQPGAAFYPGNSAPNAVVLATGGWPDQFTKGFVGLLAIADGFSYQADLKTGKILGYIQGRSSVGGLGHMLIGTLTKIEKVELSGPDGQTHVCPIQPVKSDDPAGAAWSFECALDGATAGSHYRYPIEVTYQTDKQAQGSSAGQLQGVWGSTADALYLPIPEDIQAIFMRSQAVKDLLSDHIPVLVTYTAQLDPQQPKFASLAGEVVLLGQTQIQGQTLRYSIGTPFAIENGSLTYWSLTRAALDKMLAEISPLALTKRVMGLAVPPELNMWYAEKGTLPNLPQLINSSRSNYKLEGTACADIPAWSLPADNQPLEAFGFNNGWQLYMADFVLLNGRPIVNELDLWPNRDDRGGLLPLLVPAQLSTGAQPPFERIWIESNPLFGKQPSLTLWTPDKADPASLAVYQQIAKSLPVPVKMDTIWEASA
jgi:hypothetical protein